jgi:hypothetical protein
MCYLSVCNYQCAYENLEGVESPVGTATVNRNVYKELLNTLEWQTIQGQPQARSPL